MYHMCVDIVMMASTQLLGCAGMESNLLRSFALVFITERYVIY